MEPKQITSPRGMENSRVRKKTARVCRNPAKSCKRTVENMVFPPFMSALLRTKSPFCKGGSAFCKSLFYFARVRLYFSARASRVPSAIHPAIRSLNLAVMSESFRKATPYSSLVRLMPAARLS